MKLHRHMQDKWILMILLGPALLALIFIMQFLSRFLATDKSHGDSLFVTVVDIFSALAGIAAVIVTILLPLWIVMYYRARSKKGISRVVGVLVAAFVGPFYWLYTYEVDKKKFWIGLVLSLVTLGIAGIVFWVWALIDSAGRPDEFYEKYKVTF